MSKFYVLIFVGFQYLKINWPEFFVINRKQIQMKKVNKKHMRFSLFFDKMATSITKASGKPAAFILACVIVIVWVITGPIFKFSDTWQLVINTGTTIITFLMVFIIQQTQNKDTIALQLKLNELIASSGLASNHLISVEDLTTEELEVLKKFYTRLAVLAKKEKDIHASYSLNEAELSHLRKLEAAAKKAEDKIAKKTGTVK
jgi:low affinity Fe/Cu permease